MRIRTAALLFLVLLPAESAAAQFHIVLPPAMTADSVCAVKLAENAEDRCGSHYDSLPTIPAAGGSRRYLRTIVPKPSLRHTDRAVQALYGGDALDLVNGFDANVAEERLYFASTLLAGLLGQMRFELSVAKLVSAEEPSVDSPLTVEQHQRASSAVYRLINNGGSASARVLVPLWVGGGTVTQGSTGLYGTVGYVGPLNDSSVGAGSVGAVWEGLVSFSIRDPDHYETEGNVTLGARAGIQYVVEDRMIDPSSGVRTLPYAQLALGLRGGPQMLVTGLWTVTGDEMDPFVNRLQLAISALGR